MARRADVSSDALLREGTEIVELVAGRLARSLGGRIDRDDLCGLGRLALVEIVRSYDPVRGGFRSYALQRVRWAILDGIRRETHGRATLSRARALSAAERVASVAVSAAEAREAAREGVPADEATYQDDLKALLAGSAAAMVVGLVSVGGDLTGIVDEATSPEDRTANVEVARALRECVATLPERERTLVERHYFDGEPFDAIARDLGVSKSWASRLHDRAVRALAEQLVLRTGR